MTTWSGSTPASENVGNILLAPSFRRVGSTTDEELLYSTVGYTQKGCTLAPGQGVLTLGMVMGRNSTTKLWGPCKPGAGDGTETPRGVLRTAVNTGTDPNGTVYQGNIVIRGILKNSKVTFASGASQSSIVTALNARVDAVMDTFTF